MINKDTLRSSIKAYCLELMKETSTSGGAGGYLTKKAFRSTKKQDLKSPTGFESSPNPNMYTKTMKFKIVKPKERLNSKDLWKEIKVNNPNQIRTNLTSGDKNNIIVYKKNVKYSDYKDEIEKSLKDQGYDDSWDRNEVTWSIISFPDSNNPNKQYWWTDDEINWKLNESRYTQFKQQTSKPKPKEILHKAIKEIQFKLDEVNRLIEFTTRIKGELTEGEQEIEYLKRTKNSIYKIYEKLKEAFEKISSIDEIRVNQPTKTWDFTRFIPNLDLKKIQVKDKIKLKNGKEFIVDDFYVDHNVEDIIFIDKDGIYSAYGMNLAATNRWNEKTKLK
jgi:hypothetical protein